MNVLSVINLILYLLDTDFLDFFQGFYSSPSLQFYHRNILIHDLRKYKEQNILNVLILKCLTFHIYNL